MPTDDSKPTHSFADLEKQLAKDTLEKALKDLHKEIIRDIEKNKTTFSEEIQRTLEDFKEDLERSVSEEMDKKLSFLFEKHFKDTSLQVKGSFKETNHRAKGFSICLQQFCCPYGVIRPEITHSALFFDSSSQTRQNHRVL